MDDIRSLIGEMQGEERQLLSQRTEESEASALSTRYTIFVGTITAFVLLSITSVLVTRNIAIPLRRISMAAAAMAAGDLSVDVRPDDRPDEVGVVTRTFAKMAESLRALAKAAEKIAAGDLRLTVEPRSEKDVLGKAFGVMTERLRRITTEMKESVTC
jgi:nitrogen fixation/metabolism regulation signal transduction histidine kinase